MTIFTNLRHIKPSATLAIHEKSAALVQSGKTVYRFGFGQSPFPVPDTVVKRLQQFAHEKAYLPVLGLWELREAVADFHSRLDHIEVSADQVIIGPGSKELMYQVMLANNWHVVIPAPAWVSYEPQANLVGLPASRIPADFDTKWRITPDSLRNALSKERPNLLILNYPGNPDGLTYSEDELKALAAVCKEHHVTVISDEIYGRLHHDNNHVSLARFYPEGTIITGGLSKWCGAGGWRLGTMVLPKQFYQLRDCIAGIASETFSCVSSPVQFAAVEAFEFGTDIQDYLWHCQRILKSVAKDCHEQLVSAGVKVHPAVGGFYFMIDLSDFGEKIHCLGLNSSQALFSFILDTTGVALLPGTEFGMSESHFCARFAFVDFDGQKALEESRRYGKNKPLDEAFLNTITAHSREGVQALCKWLKSL